MGYGQFVGRLGALAVALGIGVVAPALAGADPVSEPADRNAAADSNSEVADAGVAGVDSSDSPSTTDASPDADAQELGQAGGATNVGPVVSQESEGGAPPVVVRSSGGGHSNAAADPESDLEFSKDAQRKSVV